MFKKIVFLSTIIIFFIVGCKTVYSENIEDKVTPNTLTVLGDSISTGYGLDGYDTDTSKISSYGNLLAKEYSITDSYYNFAIDGETSTGLLSKLKQNQYDKYIEESEVIIISIGGNDLINLLGNTIIDIVGLPENSNIMALINIDFTDKDIQNKLLNYFLSNNFSELNSKIVTEFENNFNEIAYYIYNKNPNANIIFQNIYNPFCGPNELVVISNITDSIIKILNNIIINNTIIEIDNKQVQMYKYIDVYSAFKDESSEFTNIDNFDIHPNANGHKKIFELCNNIILNSEDIFIETTEMTTSSEVDVENSSIIETKINDAIKKNNNNFAILIVILVVISFLVLIILRLLKRKKWS